MRSCFSCRLRRGPSPSPTKTKPKGTLKTASNKALMILLQQPNISRSKKGLIQRELRRRNKNNYGYELAKMFGASPPPTNKIRVSNANVLGRIVKQSDVPLRNLRIRFAPEHTGQFTRTRTPKPNNPRAREYRLRRKLVRAGLELTGIQNTKQLKSLQRANNYATGRSSNKPANSTMRYYFRTHPRAIFSHARTVNNIQRALRERIQSNLFEYINVPNRNNLRQKWEILTNKNQVNTLENLVKKMRRYKRNTGNALAGHNAQTFTNMYNRALTRNQYGFYYR